MKQSLFFYLFLGKLDTISLRSPPTRRTTTSTRRPISRVG